MSMYEIKEKTITNKKYLTKLMIRPINQIRDLDDGTKVELIKKSTDFMGNETQKNDICQVITVDNEKCLSVNGKDKRYSFDYLESESRIKEFDHAKDEIKVFLINDKSVDELKAERAANENKKRVKREMLKEFVQIMNNVFKNKIQLSLENDDVIKVKYGIDLSSSDKDNIIKDAYKNKDYKMLNKAISLQVERIQDNSEDKIKEIDNEILNTKGRLKINDDIKVKSYLVDLFDAYTLRKLIDFVHKATEGNDFEVEKTIDFRLTKKVTLENLK